MIHSQPVFRMLGLCGLVLLSVAGCETESEPSSLDYSAPAFPYVELAPMAPPEPIAEMVPIAQMPQAEIWRPGHWSYENGAYVWVSGQMMPRPDPTAVWAPDHWVRHNYGWAYIAGYWQ